jgi:hypothetical protein
MPIQKHETYAVEGLILLQKRGRKGDSIALLTYIIINMMMKKFLVRTFLVLLVVGLIGGGWLYYVSTHSNPWHAETIGDIPAPKGYSRVEASKGSYAEYLRNLPLKEAGTKIQLFTGGNANLQWLGTAVIDNPLLSNYEQCADVTMRLRAEYLWQQGRYSDICFRDVNGNNVRYKGGSSRKLFEKYMRQIYGICSTYSVFNETSPRSIKDVQAGDVLVYPARMGAKYGHAVLVVDVAKNASGKVAIMCAEGNTPARDQHIVRNLNPLDNPWFFFDESDDVFVVGPFYFNKNELRCYE